MEAINSKPQEAQPPNDSQIRLNFDEFTEQFCQYHLDNPHIYIEFKKLALRLIRKGRKHYGAKAIFEVIRFNNALKGNDQLKINNNFTPYYARLFAKDYPKHKDFFNTRKSKFDETEQKEGLTADGFEVIDKEGKTIVKL